MNEHIFYRSYLANYLEVHNSSCAHTTILSTVPKAWFASWAGKGRAGPPNRTPFFQLRCLFGFHRLCSQGMFVVAQKPASRRLPVLRMIYAPAGGRDTNMEESAFVEFESK